MRVERIFGKGYAGSYDEGWEICVERLPGPPRAETPKESVYYRIVSGRICACASATE
jgi:hypothetical protein